MADIKITAPVEPSAPPPAPVNYVYPGDVRSEASEG